MKQKRGQLTHRVKAKSKELMGREIGKCELRLFPYLMYVMMNRQRIEPYKIGSEERKVLARLKEDGHIEGGDTGLSITREFWDILTEIIFIAYVDIYWEN